jgi:hypothetical protein
MKLYHYSKPFYKTIRTRANLGICTQEEINEAIRWSKLVNSPGSYHDHVSFFFDPLPLKTLAKIFHGANDFWTNGNEIYEYIVDTTVLDPDILFFITESPYQVEMLDKTDWVYTDEFKIEYMKNKHKKMKAMGEIGNGIRDLEIQIKNIKVKLSIFILRLVNDPILKKTLRCMPLVCPMLCFILLAGLSRLRLFPNVLSAMIPEI